MASALDTLASTYPTVVSLPILWGDMDAFGHVNNTMSIRWFESSRLRLFERPDVASPLRDRGLAPILASVTCQYRRQLKYPDTVHVGTRVSRVGNSSVTLEQAIVSEGQDAVASEGEAVVVCFDYEAQRPRRIPDDLRTALEQLRGEAGAG